MSLPDLQKLWARIGEIEKLATSPARHGKHGNHGRDGRDGKDGKDGRDGTDGVSVNVEEIRALASEIVDRAASAIPVPRDGLDGIDGRDGANGKDGRDGADGLDGIDGKQGEPGPRGPRGERGPRGPQGEIGPMPRHEWRGSELRFEVEPEVWGDWTDLRGPAGRGGGGPGRAFGGTGTASTNSYFPSGW